jgi:hypothetical protein
MIELPGQHVCVIEAKRSLVEQPLAATHADLTRQRL